MSTPDRGRPIFVTIIPAYSGFCVLGVLSGDRGFPSGSIQYPVVAWALEEGSLAPYPITLEGVQTDNSFILQPDGSVERPCLDGFANISDWLADQQQEYARKAGQ